jgi:hypothetical protein
MRLDGPVSLIAIAEIAAEAAHGEVAAAIHRVEFVDVGKLARRHERHSEPIDSRQRVAQLRVGKTDRRALDGFSEIPCRRPIPRDCAGL